MGQPIDCGRIIRAIDRLWDRGIALSDDTLFFLDSCLGITTAQDLADMLGTDDAPDRDMILEMILFPGENTRLNLEPLMGHQGLDPEQINDITRHLILDHGELTLIHPRTAGLIRMAVPPAHVTIYIDRLFLDRSVDPDIGDALAACFSQPDFLSCRALLRRRSPDLKNGKKAILLDFIRNAGDREGITGLLDLLLAILSDMPDAATPESCFLQRYFQEKKRLKTIRRFEEKRARYNMEYLMMSRYLVPHESVEQVLDRIGKLDILLFEILGISRLKAVEPAAYDLGAFDPKADVSRLRQILS